MAKKKVNKGGRPKLAPKTEGIKVRYDATDIERAEAVLQKSYPYSFRRSDLLRKALKELLDREEKR